MSIWDDFKAYWQLNGTPLAERSKVNVVDRQTGGPAGPILMTDGPDRVDLTLPETSPLYIFSTIAAPFSAVGGVDLWLAPYGQLQDSNAIYTPIGRRQVLSDLTFHCISNPLATDTVQIDICKNGTNPSGLTLTVPANTNTSTFLLANTFPVTFEVGDTLAIRLRQSGNTAQAAWNAYILVG